MNSVYSKQTLYEPDGLTGAILAVEGIRDAAVLLNGPTGCKFYHGAVAEGQLPRESSYDPFRFLDEFYFGQPRVPATYLDGDDYVFGASDKLERILPIVASKGHSMLAVINSPGAALIGDDLDRFVQTADLAVPCVTIETTGYSGSFEDGFQEALIRVLETLSGSTRNRETDRKAAGSGPVNLIGVSILEKYWEGNIAELRRLLSLCGVGVNAVLSAGTAADELRAIPEAGFNVMLREELGAGLADWTEKRYGIETIRPCSGAPIGFDQTEQWVRAVCRAAGKAPDPAMDAIDEARGRAVMHIKRFNSLTGLPKGATFAVKEGPSIKQPLARWLHAYLGMVETDMEEADIIFADGAAICGFHEEDEIRRGIEISLPSRSSSDLVLKCIYGAKGAMYLIEWIVNILNDNGDNF
jgi:nitrogenase molybdenum-iron protein alpha/beta subunit